MRIVQWSDLPAVVRVETGEDVTVAIPQDVPRSDVLCMASLILSNGEYGQLCDAMTPAQSAPAGGGASRHGSPSSA
jgi:hypothetical protein